MPFLNPNLKLDFSQHIKDRTYQFTGRDWVFEAIYHWLEDTESSRFFLLTGDPGSGKSTIAARLAQFSQGEATYSGLSTGFLYAVHFCSARDSVWIDPKEFVRSIALQLAANLPEFALALKDIGDKTTNINVDLVIGTAQNSNIKGVVIENLILSGLTGQEAFTQVVVNPLRQIQQKGSCQPLTVLVDSLDEALTHDGASTIVGLLSTLPASINLRWIVTSRNEGRVKEKLEESTELCLSAEENLDNNNKDIESYIDTKIKQEETLDISLDPETLKKKDFNEKLLEKAEGNFLYVRFFLDSVDSGQQTFADLNSFPQGLDELYYRSLGRVIELGGKTWSEVYAPIIGVLSAAQEGLTEEQIRAFVRLKESVVWDGLNDLQQFLDEIESQDSETLYRLYHQSVSDFLSKRRLLIKNKKLNNRYYLPPDEQHQRLLTYYNPEDKPWDEMQLERIDIYGRRYIAQHLTQTGNLEALHALLANEKAGRNAWFDLKDRAGEIDSFLADIRLAWSQAYMISPIKSLGLQCRYALIQSSISALAEIPTALFSRLVETEYWTLKKAVGYAHQALPGSQKRCDRLVAVATILPKLTISPDTRHRILGLSVSNSEFKSVTDDTDK